MGVCKGFGVPEPGTCWNEGDCAYGEYCAGVQLCPCDADCDMEDTKGTCMPTSGDCCFTAKIPIPAECGPGQFCMSVDGGDTCHAYLDQPYCWNDDDCSGGVCEGAEICSCNANCISQPGFCR
jgi:hypothetical protein